MADGTINDDDGDDDGVLQSADDDVQRCDLRGWRGMCEEEHAQLAVT